MKVCTIVGARPQFIKAAAISRVLKDQQEVTEVLVHTGQHYDKNLSDGFFKQLNIPAPNYNLGVGSAMHGAQTGRMLELIEKLLLQEYPDCVLLYGDTNSTLAGALAAVKHHFQIAHVEAGLRSFNLKMPEEVNRVLTDHVSDLLFAPTTTSVENLEREGITKNKIHLVGDVMYDVALYYAKEAQAKSRILKELCLEPKSYCLVTIHRAENVDHLSRLKAIVAGLSEVAKELPVVLPLHPRTRNALERGNLLKLANQKLTLMQPLGYLDMVILQQNAWLIATDSGGVQKEAFFHRVPCVTLREETEWVELVESGWNRLVPPTSAEVVASGVLGGFCAAEEWVSPYGDGDSADKIVKTMLKI